MIITIKVENSGTSVAQRAKIWIAQDEALGIMIQFRENPVRVEYAMQRDYWNAPDEGIFISFFIQGIILGELYYICNAD